MLLTAGERISMALLAMAIANLGHEARSFTGSQAGVITDSAHGKARIIDVTPGPHPHGARRGRHRDRRRLPGRLAGHQGHHHARPRRLGHDRRRARGGARRRRVRDLHRRRRRLHRRPAHRPDGPPAADASPTRRCSRWPQPAPRCCTCAASSTPAATTFPIHVRSSFIARGHVRHAAGAPRPGAHEGDTDGAGDHLRRRPRPQRGQGHRRRRPRQAGRGRRHLPRRRRRRDQHRHDRAERLRRLHRPHGHLLHAAQDRRARAHGGAREGPGRRSASRRCCTTTRSARCRWSAPACGRHPGVIGDVLRGAGRRRRQRRDDLDLGDPHLGRLPRRRRRRRRDAPCTARSGSTARTRPSSTAGPGDERPRASASSAPPGRSAE